MFSMVEYATGREILRSDGNRIKSQLYKNKPIQKHYGNWRSVKTRCYSRLVDTQLIMRYFLFEDRELKFEKFIEKLNSEIAKIGQFKIILWLNFEIQPIFFLLINF